MTNAERNEMIAATFVLIIREQVEAQREAERQINRWAVYVAATRIMAILSVVLILAI